MADQAEGRAFTEFALELLFQVVTNASVRAGHAALQTPFGRRVILDAPVLVADPVVLGDVEPHKPERAVVAHPGEQTRDLAAAAFALGDGWARISASVLAIA